MKNIKVAVTQQEYDTIIAALRVFQDPGRLDVLLSAQEDIASEHGDPLNNFEIDDLIDKLQLR